MTGVGGGSLMTPLLVLLFGFHPSTAVGTDLLYASVTKTAGTVVHGKRQTVDWKIVGGLALGSVPAAIATLGVMAYFDVKTAHSAFLLHVLREQDQTLRLRDQQDDQSRADHQPGKPFQDRGSVFGFWLILRLGNGVDFSHRP